MSVIKTSSDLLRAAALQTQIVTVKDVTVQIRELSVAARDAFHAAMKSGGNTAAVISVLKHGVLNGNGEPLLSDEDATQLSESSPGVAEGLAQKILELSGLWEDDAGEDKS